MKNIILIIALIISAGAKAQDDKTVTLVVSGQGKTKDEAKQIALRSAIEQAFGAFISAKSELLNDSLVKDEVTMISSGTVLDYKSLNETKLPDSSYSVTLNATVSISSLKKIAESKGEIVAINGALFGMKLKLAKLQMEAEIKVIKNLCKVSAEILSKSLDYKLEIRDPVTLNSENNLVSEIKQRYIFNGTSFSKTAPLLINIKDSDQIKLRIIVENKTNNSFDFFIDFFNNTLKSIKMSAAEIEFAKTSNIEHSSFNLIIFKESSMQFEEIYLRSQLSHQIINKFMYQSIFELYNYKIFSDNNSIEFSLLDCGKYKPLCSAYSNQYGLPKESYSASDLLFRGTELKINKSCYVIIPPIIPSISNYHQVYIENCSFPDCRYFDSSKLMGEYYLFYNNFKNYTPEDYRFWTSKRYNENDDFGFYTYGKPVIYIKNLKRENNWNTRYQVYDFYLPLSELEKINEIKVVPYTTP